MKHIKSFEFFLEALIGEFSYEDFAPENNSQLIDRFKKKFYAETAYWIKCPKMSDNNSFEIEFKKYGENRQKIGLIFSLKPRCLNLILCKDKISLQDNDSCKELLLSDIWMDHSILFRQLTGLMVEGLKKAQETNN